MSGLSSRVMNMKFMQPDSGSNSKSPEPHDQAKVKDASEWGLPNSSKIKAKLKSNRVVESVGYSGINSFGRESFANGDEPESDSTPVNLGRRTFGNDKNDKKESSLDVDDIKETQKKNKPKEAKKMTKLDPKKASGNEKPIEEPELGTKAFLESLLNKPASDSNKTDAKAPSNKRKSDNQEDYKPEIKNKRKRFSNFK